MLASVGTILLQAFVPIVAGYAAVLVVQGVHAGVRWLKNKVHNDAADALFSRLDAFAEKAVLATEQTVVDSLRKANKWGDGESYVTAAAAALDALKKLAAAELPKLAAAGVENADAYLRQLLEAKVKEIEQRNPRVDWPKMVNDLADAGLLPPFITSGNHPPAGAQP